MLIFDLLFKSSIAFATLPKENKTATYQRFDIGNSWIRFATNFEFHQLDRRVSFVCQVSEWLSLRQKGSTVDLLCCCVA